MSTQIVPASWQSELRAPRAASLIAASPERVRRLMVECLGLVERELPFEVLPTLRWLERDLDLGAALDAGASERLKDARLGCWKHLEACACYGVGTEVHAVRALLTILETLSHPPTTDELAEVLRLVQAAGARPEAFVERLAGVLAPAGSEAGHAE